MILGDLEGQKFGAYSAAPTFFQTLLKTWEEYQSIHFFRPKGDNLKTFTKANYKFSQTEFQRLSFQLNPDFAYQPDLASLAVASDSRSGRHIVYLYQRGRSATK